MRTLTIIGALALAAFEAAHVYLIMPMPGSQGLESVGAAHLLHAWRWGFRVLCVALMLAGLGSGWRGPIGRKALVVLALLVVGAVTYMANFVMSADRMFLQPASLTMAGATENHVDPARLVVGVVRNGEARAYPIQFIGYHHQVRDTVGGEPIMVTYCTVCRTGRVFSPRVGGAVETFRLVGMEQFNAMFEDRSTGSWWRQATGEAIAGPRRGMRLDELPSSQVTLDRWLSIHPNTLVMQADSSFAHRYARTFDYESGASRATLTGTDPVPWREKAWVVGLEVNGASKAYDWDRLKRERVVNDVVGGTPVVLVLASDNQSFLAFQRPDPGTLFEVHGDSLVSSESAYSLSGTTVGLAPVQASQEFWHSWRTFHPRTERY